MAAEVDIYNMALALIGNSSAVANVGETSAQAKTCARFYEHCRDMVLTAHPWNFARKRISLPLLVDAPPTNWGYAYGYPSDCMAARALVLEGSRVPIKANEIPHEVCLVGGAKAICCDVRGVELIYTARVEDPNTYGPHVISALAHLLGFYISGPLSSLPGIKQAMWNGYMAAISTAAACDLSEGNTGPEPDGEILGARL